MMLTPTIVAIVPAAGFGHRMKMDLPKQYLKIGKKTVLEHTLDKLLSCKAISRIILAIGHSDNLFKTLTVARDPRIKSVIGGRTRADSVMSALSQINDNEWVMVHDAARPCVTQHDINKLIKTVFRYHQGGILAIPIVDTVKLADKIQKNRIMKTVDRNLLWSAVTPQLFLAKELKISLEKAMKNNITITDEASAIEYNGGHPLLVYGRRDNLKITLPEDLSLAKFYIHEQCSIDSDKKATECE